MDGLTTKQAAEILGVSPRRVIALIEQERLNAVKFGGVYLIARADLAAVRERKNGRPQQAKNGATARQQRAPLSFAEVAAKYIGSIKDGLPTDLSTNKSYLKNLGKKSAEKAALKQHRAIPDK